MRGFGLKPEQRVDGVGGALLFGSGLEVPAKQDKRDDRRCGIEVNVCGVPDAKPFREENGHGAVGVGRAGSNGDKRVHVRGAVTRRREKSREEAAPRHKQDRRGEKEQQFVGLSEGKKE